METSNSNRRDFLKAGAIATATAASVNLLPTGVHAAGNETIKVGLIGCGGRGTGAVKDSLEADKSIQIHALGDFFLDKAQGYSKQLSKDYGERAAIGDRVFGGLDNYKQVLNSGVDLVILADRKSVV